MHTRVPAFVLGTAAGLVVTRSIHRQSSGFWTERVGSTPLRRGDLPVGGTVATALSLIAPGPLRPALRALAVGATLGVAIVAAAEPLPPAQPGSGLT